MLHRLNARLVSQPGLSTGLCGSSVLQLDEVERRPNIPLPADLNFDLESVSRIHEI
jgi:hypothetical protein